MNQVKRDRHGRDRGFTLIEVLVAITIIGIALVALVRLFSDYTAQFGSLREQFYNQNVSWNELAKVHVAQEVGGLKMLQKQGTEDQLGLSWKWQLEKESTEAETIVLLHVRSSPEDPKNSPRLSTMILSGSGFAPEKD